MNLFEKEKIILIFLTIWFCNTGPYIKQFPAIASGKEVLLEICLDSSLMLKYDQIILTKYCLSRTERNLEENCEVDPLVRYYPIMDNEQMRFILP